MTGWLACSSRTNRCVRLRVALCLCVCLCVFVVVVCSFGLVVWLSGARRGCVHRHRANLHHPRGCASVCRCTLSLSLSHVCVMCRVGAEARAHSQEQHAGPGGHRRQGPAQEAHANRYLPLLFLVFSCLICVSASDLWRNNIKAEFLYDEAPKATKQMEYANENKIPFVLFIGEAEIQKGVVKIKVCVCVCVCVCVSVVCLSLVNVGRT